MTSLLQTLIVEGVGIAAAPWCIIGVIVVLGTSRPLANAAAFIGGAVVAMVLYFALCSLIFGDVDLTVHTTPESTTDVIKLVLGVVLGAWGGWRWFRRGPTPTPDAPEPAEPKWLSLIDRVRPLIAFPIGMCMPNPIFAVAGSIAILKADVSAWEEVFALVIFILVSLSTLIAPVVVYVRSPGAVTSRLQVWRKWLALNSGAILTVLLLFYGSLLVLEGVNGLRG